MDTNCLLNSISRFIDLVSNQTLKPMSLQKHCNNMVGVLKCLEPAVLADDKISLDENLCRECEELDMQVNEAREFIEKWDPEMSKIHGVLQSGELLTRLQNTTLMICQMIVESPISILTDLQHNMQQIQCVEKESAMVFIEEAVSNQRDNNEPCYEHLEEIIEFVELTSNHEVMKESIAVERERLNKRNGQLDDQIVNLVCRLRDYVMKTKCLEVKSGVSVPSYFRCPLSLELMLDPVIVASGRTYERQSIQTWLDHNLIVCPQSHQTLSHTNLIPNHTVKAMIANWCDENNVKLNSIHFQPSQDLNSTVSTSHSSNSNAKSSLPSENNGESNKCQSFETESYEQKSFSPAWSHSRSESFSSSVSNSDYLLEVSKELSDQIQNVVSKETTTNEFPASPAYGELGNFSSLSQGQFQTPGSKLGRMDNENNNIIITSHSNSKSDTLTNTSHVNKLIEDLQSESDEMQSCHAAEELRLLTKHNTENRKIVGRCGAIMHLVPLLYSEMKKTQEHAVTALLNLSINEDNKTLIMEAGAIEPLIHVLQTGNDSAKENSAATLFSLSVLEENKVKIGRSGAIKALVDLLASSGTLRGKKDAATALFNLSIYHKNKSFIVQAGAVKILIMLLDPGDEMVDKAIALLANLSTIAEGRLEIVKGGGIPLLVELFESGSQRGKENAASTLLQLCLHSRRFCTMVLQEGAVPPLVALSQSGTPRAKEKAKQLLSHFRNQRQEATLNRKS